MSELKMSEISYPIVEQWKTLGNKAENNDEGTYQLIKIEPKFKERADNAVRAYLKQQEEQMNTADVAKNMNARSSIPMFTAGSGAVTDKVIKQRQTNDGFEVGD